jgi:hypothetical protein
MMAKAVFKRGALAWLGFVTACSSGSPSGAAPDAATGATDDAGGSGAASCAGSAITWKDDGTPECASSWVASGLHGNTPGNPDDSVEIVGTQGLDISISIAVAAAPPIGGTYGCAPSPNGTAEFTYRDSPTSVLSVESCSVTLNLASAGDGGVDGGPVDAIGTFSAVLAVADAGTTKNLTGGVFDVVVQY